ncbi:MFS transporter [Leucothrix arctica]|nr:MFS transporter [Leucothrix arctica]
MNTQQLTRAIVALCLGSIAVFINLYAAQPLLPVFANEFQLTELEAARSLTISTFMLGLSLLFYGPLSDAIGRKVIMSVTLVCITITSFALSYASSYEELLLLRALQGFFLGGIPATAVAYIGEEFPRAKVAAIIGFYISANSIGGITGRILGGFVSDLADWQTVFLVVTVINTIITSYFILALPASVSFIPQKLRLSSTVHKLYGHLCNRQLLVAYFIGGFHFMIVLTLYSYIIFVLADAPYSLSSSWLGLLFLTYASGTIGSAFIGTIDKKISCARRIIMGTCFIIVGTLCTLQGSLMMIISGLLISTFGFFVAHSSLSGWVNTHAIGAKASASSLYLVFYYMGASLGTRYLNPFWDLAGYPGVVAASIVTLSGVLVAGAWLCRQECRNKATTLQTI